jgi:hypothetical protein
VEFPIAGWRRVQHIFSSPYQLSHFDPWSGGFTTLIGGASILLLFIPFVNIVIAFMLLFHSGTRGTNNHGANVNRSAIRELHPLSKVFAYQSGHQYR